ncbi:dihydrofolate reductase [Lachnospiraceae bacterium HCP1S3_C3]|nr:dihydrofolate reductase [Lachnospiraceae bacterium]MDD6857079.1 dihydrofolate reductase [Lachnospiraceae bacterium]
MKLIVAVDRNWAIGNEGKLLASIPEDMKFFRTTTTGNVVVMGRKTLESFPGKRPLKNRVNIVLTRDEGYTADGAVIVHDIEELLAKIKDYSDKDIYVIGGGTIYNQLLRYCDTALVTYIDDEFKADTYFPDLDKDESWKMADSGERKEHEGTVYYFRRYDKM